MVSQIRISIFCKDTEYDTCPYHTCIHKLLFFFN